MPRPDSAEMSVGPGFRIRGEIDRPSPQLVTALGEFDVADISDRMNRMYTLDAAIKPVTDPELRIIGPACTVKTYPGDNLMVHKCLDIAQPGDVVVIDTGGSTTNAVLGDTIATKAHHRGIAGFVIDGLVRDLQGILDVENLPVYARGVTPVGPLHRGPGEINYAVSVGGVVVQAGDIIIGDRSGVVVIDPSSGDEILDRLQSRAAATDEYLRNVRAGKFSNEWVDEILRESGVEPAGMQ